MASLLKLKHFLPNELKPDNKQILMNI